MTGRCVCGHLWEDHHERDGCGGCALAFYAYCRRWPADPVTEPQPKLVTP